ncbi:MAG: 16S rRNA (adenine(1518)-N(6)/adenine(1519)-N(6))-dimethyltransferase RsmA [Armatimonadetes bacterium]|nr:16S rRNA (adenine(1518)-N(6)/adenine(1519)-N(6))-dimethyltransferase RsmA [Armatimonadota bacterium]
MDDPAQLATPAGTARVLRAFGVRPRKRFGQHFLVSRRVLDRLLAEADLAPGDRVLEVGAGLGTLTAALAATGASVLAVELDDRLIPILRAATAGFPSVRIVHGDIMKMDLVELVGEGGRSPDFEGVLTRRGSVPPPPPIPRQGSFKMVANLPYGIASPLLIRALESLPALERAIVTVQAEVGERMRVDPGSKAYGALTVAVQYRADAARVMRVPPGAFYPPPEVDSAVLRLTVLPRPRVAVADEALFFAVVRAAFGQRRKVLRNALAGLRPDAGAAPVEPAQVEEACRRAGIDPRRRGETLSLAEFAALADALRTMAREDGGAGAEGGGWNGAKEGTTHLAASGGH